MAGRIHVLQYFHFEITMDEVISFTYTYFKLSKMSLIKLETMYNDVCFRDEYLYTNCKYSIQFIIAFNLIQFT